MGPLKVGQHYLATLTSSDPAQPVPPGTTVATSDNTGVVTIAGGPSDATFQINAVGPGNATVTYSAPGFDSASEALVVMTKPSLVVTNGPVEG